MQVVVPIGVDENGAPMSFTIWGKAMPKEETFCDKCAETFDLEFLYKVKKVVAALHGPDSPLKRVPSPLAMADGQPAPVSLPFFPPIGCITRIPALSWALGPER